MKIKKDDKVVVLSGKDKGKQGKVLIADPKNAKVVVEGKCGKATRVGFKVENGKKTRVCKKCGAEI